MTVDWVRSFDTLASSDLGIVGGKNAALGEMIRELSSLGVPVPGGFAITASAYRAFLAASDLEGVIRAQLDGFDPEQVGELQRRAAAIRAAIVAAPWPPALADAIVAAYAALCGADGDVSVAVRSSATAEDLPTASFAGQQETYLHVRGATSLLEHARRCFASLFTARAVAYRAHRGFGHLDVGLSVGVQRMVRSDEASAGVLFTLDPDSGHRDFVYVTAAFGLGETVVQGRVVPDGYWVHAPTLRLGFPSVVRRQLGAKAVALVQGDGGLREVEVDAARREAFALTDDEVLKLARWALIIQDHFTKTRGVPTPMDIEWGKDGPTGELFILQARPETVHAQAATNVLRTWRLTGAPGVALAEGLAVGGAIASGVARVVDTPDQLTRVQPGDVLVARITDPDWEPVMKKAAAIVTEEGGRTSHAAIVAREHGIPAVVGAAGAQAAVAEGTVVTVSCAQGDAGRVYAGAVAFEVEEVDLGAIERPRTKILANVGDPEQAMKVSMLPVDGIGLARMEFVFAGWVGVHPLALLHPERLPDDVRAAVAAKVARWPSAAEYFIDRLSQGIAMLSAAFYPRPVILRFSDFKTNEYAHLLGGEGFEPHEENPMIGWRGASRYAHPAFREAFALEVAAVRRVRERMGLVNLHVMVPFCRTPEEGRAVIAELRAGGLIRGEEGLKYYVMAEIPSNILLAEEFAKDFDGFSIGSNDLTQLLYGVDRDSTTVSALFDDDGPALQIACKMLLDKARLSGTTVGICGQSPSDHPAFAAFLVRNGIDSLSLTPDSVLRTLPVVVAAERER